MRWLTVMVTALAVLASAAPAGAGGDSAGVHDDVVWVNPQAPGAGSGGNGSGGSGSDGGAECDYVAVPQDATDGFGPQGEKIINGVAHFLFYQDCLNGLPIQGVWVPLVTPRDLLPDVQALIEARLSYPTVNLQPVDPDFGWTYVQVPTDFRVDSDEWVPVEAYAEVSNPLGTVWVRATAIPTVLAFDPGDRSELTSCDGNGPVARYSPTTPGACSVTYRASSATSANGHTFTATAAIVWSVTWESSDPAESGTLDVEPTQSTVDVAVAEAKGLVYCTGSRAGQGGC